MSLLLENFAKAIETRDAALVASMIANNKFDINARLPRNGNPPALVLAAKSLNAEIADVLLKAGAKIDKVDDNGHSACHVAALQSGSPDLLQVLLAHRPNLALVESWRRTPLHFSLMSDNDSGDRKSIMLIDAGAPLGQINLFQLAQRSLAAPGAPALRSLLKRGVVMSDVRDRFMNTLLHLAAKELRDRTVLTFLINDCGIDLEARNDYSSTCCHIAASTSNAVALRCLVEAGANVNAARVDNGMMPLHTAKDFECAVILLAAGADVNTLVAKLVESCVVLPLLFDALLAAGVKLDTKDRDGITFREHLSEYFDIDDGDVDPVKIDSARREIAKVRLDFVRHRAMQVCVGLQSLDLAALEMCEILLHACGPLAPLVPFHQWWAIATTVKHFFKSK